MTADDPTRRRRGADLKVGWSKLAARARQIFTTDPTTSDEDDRVVEEAGAAELAKQAGQLKGGLAKVAQLMAYGATGEVGVTRGARATLGALWDQVPALPAAAVARVVEEDLGKPPQALFARWSPDPIAAASLGQVHAALGHDGVEYAVKVQYPGIADGLRADLDSTGFARRLAGAGVGRSLDDAAVDALRAAVLGELDYRAEADAIEAFGRAWADDPVIAIPAVDRARSSTRVLTMTRARGRTLTDVAAAVDDVAVREATATAIFRFAWGSPLVHGLLNADPNPGNYLVDVAADGAIRVSFLDFGCVVPIAPELIERDRELWYGVMHEDVFAGAERFRMALAAQGLLVRADSLTSTAHRDWERELARPLSSHVPFPWTRGYADELAATTQRVLAAGGVALPAPLILLWRQRLGVAAVLGLLDVSVGWRRLLVDLIGVGRKALR